LNVSILKRSRIRNLKYGQYRRLCTHGRYESDRGEYLTLNRDDEWISEIGARKQKSHKALDVVVHNILLAHMKEQVKLRKPR